MMSCHLGQKGEPGEPGKLGNSGPKVMDSYFE